MQTKIEELLKAIGLPVGLAAVIVSIAIYLGLPLEQAGQLFGILTGLPFVIGLLVDLFKLVGIVRRGASGIWTQLSDSRLPVAVSLAGLWQCA
jgi:hypothetical protein